MQQFKYNSVLLALIGLGLVAALIIGWQRHVVEQQNTISEIVIDYDDVVELAQLDGTPVPEVMRQFKDAGVTSLAVYDTTLEKLQKYGKLSVVPGADLMARYRTGELDKPLFIDQGGRISSSEVYIFAGRQEPGGPETFAEVKEDLARRLGPENVRELTATDSRLAMVVNTNYEKALKLPLGLSSEEMRLVAENGFYIVPRPANYVKVSPDDIKAVFDRLRPFPSVSGLVFVGEESLGYPDQLPVTAQYLKDSGITLYMVESPIQLQFMKMEGLVPLGTEAGYKVARAYIIQKEEQVKLKPADAVHRWGTTDRERNIRVNLLRKFDRVDPGLSLLETNVKYARDVRDTIAAKGFTFGRAQSFEPYHANRFLLAVITVGATAAGVLFLTLLCPFKPRYQYLLVALLSALLAGPLLLGGGLLVRQSVALVSAIIFPVLALTWQLDWWRARAPHAGSSLGRIMVDGVGGLIMTTALSLVGGFYVGGILGDIRFILEMEIFRGVKLTFVMPLLLITLVYIVRYNVFGREAVRCPDDVARLLKKILDYPVYFKTLVILALGGIAAYIYVGRSGHTAGVAVPAIEVKLRSFLEDTLYARPREKEFLVGHPAFMLAVMALYRQWPRLFHYLLVLAAIVGQGSLVETFAHIRTPIYMSFVRALDGLAFGIALGLLAVVGMQLLHYLTYLLGRRPADE